MTQLKPLTEQQAISFEADLFLGVEKNKSSAVDFVLQMYNFFSETKFNSSTVRMHEQTYWKWYVVLFWRHITLFQPSEVEKIFPTVLPSAVTMSIRCLDEYIHYLYDLYERVDMSVLNTLHLNIKKNIETSAIQICFDIDQSLSLSELYSIITDALGDEKDTLERAEVFSRIELELFDKNQLVFPCSSQEKLVNLEQLNLLLRFIHTQNDVLSTIKQYEYSLFSTEEDIDIASVVDKVQIFNAAVVAAGFEPLSIASLLRPYNIFDSLSFKFSDNITQISSYNIIEFLQELVVSRNESRITDVYYFNEQTNQFEWDEALLKELKLIPPDFDMSTIAK